MISVRLTLAPLDVELTLPAGVTVIYGPPGAGKRLLLEAIAGFARPSAGRVLLDDAILFDAAAQVHLPPQRRRIGFVPHGDSLFPHMNLRRNLAFPASRWPRLERRRRVAEMVDKFQLTDDSPRINWSIARALIAEPRALLLDDPALGPALLQQLRQNFAGPVLFSSCNLDLCCAADQLLVLQAGRILQRGAPRQVIDQPASVDVARLLSVPNLFQATVGALDPGRNRSILEFEHFSLGGPYFPGHFRGDRVWVAVAAEDLQAHPGDAAPQANCVALELLRVVPQARTVLLEFAHGVCVSLSHDAFARQKGNKEWRVEFPAAALRIL